ncbi:hypothetical protein MP228_007916 [Amoeboaphelidium protococcarum]|nr:hypothetical protein MP228_007916 [Amoeboaphelidium protococcarum]
MDVLLRQKEQLESQLRLLQQQMVTVDGEQIGMHEPLIDRDGYPRADMDIMQIRQMRVQTIELQNDLRTLMKQIDLALQMHFTTRVGTQSGQINDKDNNKNAGGNASSENANATFAVIERVVFDSPAWECGLRDGDKIVSFGDIKQQSSGDKLKKIADLVRDNQDQIIQVTVVRNTDTLQFDLVPHQWDGQGTLGCFNLVKRDPEGYKDDFLRQLSHFNNLLSLVKIDPSQENDLFTEIVHFLAHVSSCYSQDLIKDGFVDKIISLLKNNYTTMHPMTRKSLVSSLMLIRSKSTVRGAGGQSNGPQRGKGLMQDATPLLSLAFFLLKCRDKNLREVLKKYIINDIKQLNSSGKNNKVNRTLQSFMFSMISEDAASHQQQIIAKSQNGGNQSDALLAQYGAIESGDASDIAAKYSLDICVELYKKQIWNDAKTVNVIADALFSPHKKVLVQALKFFLGTDSDDDDSDDEDSDGGNNLPDIKQLKFRSVVSKKAKGNKKALQKAMKVVKRKQNAQSKAESFNFSALHLLNDPQTLCERLFKLLTKGQSTGVQSQKNQQQQQQSAMKSHTELKFELKLMVMNLMSRLIGLHQLLVLNFYPYMMKYLRPKQQDITSILVILAQSVHSLVPPEECLQPLVKTLVNNFCTDSFSGEVIQAGINSIREVCSRNSLAMDKEILHYLCTFKSHREKGVQMACRGLINLFREVQPDLLPRKERGKLAQMELIHGDSGAQSGVRFGEQKVIDGIDGTELLDQDLDLAGSDGEDFGGLDGVSGNESEDNQDIESGKGRRRKQLHLGLALHQGSGDEEDDAGNEIAGEGEGSDVEGDIVGGQDPSFEEEDDESDLEIEDDGGDDFDFDFGSDSEGNDSVEEEAVQTKSVTATSMFSRVETERILTQEDFEKIRQIQAEKEAKRLVEGPAARKRKSNNMAGDLDEQDGYKRVNTNVVSTADILGYQRRRKQTKEERVAHMKQDQNEDTKKHGSRKGQHNLEKGSKTNKQKKKSKNFMMMVHKRSIASKKKMSLRDKQKKLRKHIETQKK